MPTVRAIPREGNRWAPLPPDYPTLSKEGQRLARINACCQRATAQDFVNSWLFFRSTYLDPLPEGVFYKRKLPSPPAHYVMVRDMGEYGRNIHVAPRGSAKSTVIGLEIPLLLSLTWPFSVGMLVLSAKEQAELRGTQLQQALDENKYIVDDFGQLKPPKSTGRKWSLSMMQLLNGSMLRLTSVDSRKRGARPDFVILDDPEYDPKKPGSETILRDQLDSLLFSQIIPMLDSDDQIFEWVGTLINCRSALYGAISGQDPRFEFYNRRVFSAARTDEAGHSLLFWPEKWDSGWLDVRRKELGDIAFEAEMQGNPISDKERIFNLHPLFNTYEVSDAADAVTWHTPSSVNPEDAERHTEPYAQWLNGLGKLIIVDLLHRVSAISDFSGAMCVGIDKDNAWWVLDLFLGRCAAERLMSEVWQMGVRWQPSLVGIESVGGQDYFRQWLESRMKNENPAAIWSPRAVWPIRYPHALSKEDRITALAPRASGGRIRLPAKTRNAGFPWSELWREFNLFTPDGLSLPHDDALDMLAMVPYVPRVYATGDVDAYPEGLAKDVLDLLADGQTTDPQTGLPILAGLDVSRVPLEVFQKFMVRREELQKSTAARSRFSSLHSTRERYNRAGTDTLYTPVTGGRVQLPGVHRPPAARMRQR